jgi:multidrug efflux pump subunit AcrA (membrane-fusion protein)
MECPIPVSMVKFLKVGQNVDLHSTSDASTIWNGKITRISSAVNPGTQTVNIYIETQGESLEQGMFLEASIDATEIEQAFEIDRSVLFKTNQVYIAKDSLLVQKQVNVKYLNERTAVIQGLTDGDRVLSKMPPSAYPGMRISIYTDKN